MLNYFTLLQSKGDCWEKKHASEAIGPQIELVCPSKGPAAGGTNVFIWGKRLDGLVDGRVNDRKKRELAQAPMVVDFGGNICQVLYR